MGESQSNGRVENAVQRVQGLIKTLKEALDGGGKAAGLITRYLKGQKKAEPRVEKLADMMRKQVWREDLYMPSEHEQECPGGGRKVAEEVLSMRGIPSNPVPGVGGDHIAIETNGSRHAERGEDEHTPRGKCDTLPTVAALDPTVRKMYITRAHIRDYGATEGCPGCKGIEKGSSCHTTTIAGRVSGREWRKLKRVVKD